MRSTDANYTKPARLMATSRQNSYIIIRGAIMRQLLIIVMLVLVAAGCGTVYRDTEVELRIPVYVENEISVSVQTAVCTGRWITPTQVLTAAHCVDGVMPGAPVAVLWHGMQLGGVVFAADYDEDLALVNVAQPSDAAPYTVPDLVPLCDNTVLAVVGLPVRHVCLVGGKRSELKGLVQLGDESRLYTTAEVFPGCSGGPTYLLGLDDEILCVTGVTIQMRVSNCSESAESGEAISVGHAAISRFIAEANRGYHREISIYDPFAVGAAPARLELLIEQGPLVPR